MRTQILQGGAYLAIRQALGVVLNLGGVIWLTRLIGPEAYGYYAAASGVYLYTQSIAQMGINVYLLRQDGETDPFDFHQALSLLMCLGFLVMAVSLVLLPLVSHWIQLQNFSNLFSAFVVSLPLVLFSLVPQTYLERNLDFRRLAVVEIFGLGLFYVVAIFFALKGFGAWSTAIGWWVQQLFLALILYSLSGYRPKLVWQTSRILAMIQYGFSYSSSIWIWQLRDLVNPLIVGHYLGAQAVGYIALAIRIVMGLSFVKNATWRLSLAALGRIQQNRTRLAQAIVEGMQLQVMSLGPILLVFVLVGELLVSLVFGEQWRTVLVVFPFIAFGQLVNAMFNLHSSTLYVLRQNWQVSLFHLVHILLFVGGAFLLVPRLGLVGYGWAEVIALLSYAVIHYFTRKVALLNYTIAGSWTIAFGIALFEPILGPIALLGVALILIWPQTWITFIHYWNMVRGAKNG